MDIDKLTVGELKEITKLARATNKKPRRLVEHGLQIAVLQRGWVFIGQISQIGDDYTLKNGACIRRWGTSKGLGQIANDGPTANTELEPVPELKFHEAGKILLVKAEDSKWAGKLK